jgi:hypothetical protein
VRIFASRKDSWRAGLVLGWLALASPFCAGADEPGAGLGLRPLVRAYCLECHGASDPEAGVNLEAMANALEFGRRFKDWEKVVRVLRDGKMPPRGEPQPSGPQRAAGLRDVEAGIRRFVEEHQGDPGPVAIRRLTSAEYVYTVRDLTGLDLRVADDFVSDAVAGEGFSNSGDAQFMQDSTLERYLQAARAVADHAVIGAGPLGFFADPGKTGRELSAINRIQAIYRAHGFRTAAGEGAQPFGLDLYPRAMLVVWQFRFRDRLGLGTTTLPELARAEGLSARLCEHLWEVLNRADAPFPLSLFIEGWRSLPTPGQATKAEVRGRCDELGQLLRGWQKTLAAAAGDEEEAAVLTAGEVRVAASHTLTVDLTWPAGAQVVGFELSVARASKAPPVGAVVVWRNPRVQFRRADRRRDRPRPLAPVLTPETAGHLALGTHPRGGAIGAGDFATVGEARVPVSLRIPEGMISAQLVVEVALDCRPGETGIVRCRISDGEVEGETAAEVGDTSTLLADPADPKVALWRAGVEEFAGLVPEVSHREPAPSDRDPIPAPFENTYNKPERNHFHTAIKYHRDDAFFVAHVADLETRRRLDQAWADLLTAFDYHDLYLKFVSEKFGLGLGTRTLAELDREAIDRLPAEPRQYVRRLKDEHDAMRAALGDAEPGHVEDALRFAEHAWRRPLSGDEAARLHDFYARLRRESGGGGLDHEHAIRALLARILVAPAFLYRAEPRRAVEGQGSSVGEGGIVPLTDWQLASRLSYFLWSSMPDEPLREAAAAGRLRAPAELERQARRMLRDPKARRLATEFFGQWLGFYRFDQFQGIDTGRFPEFTEKLRAALYEEAVSFFEHLVREDRPVDELLFADYTFLNRALTEHYGVAAAAAKGDEFVKVDGLAEQHRGGLLGMGAVLAATSAPRRTSAVKRGDWVLRRIVGTPVPPPPANVGSIPPDDVLTDGQTVRQRLEAHRKVTSCANCHTRIDPLGFALEPYDPLGRWRDAYSDGKPIDPSGTLRDGTTVFGPDGLRDYLRREGSNFHRTVSVKLLGFALGRAGMASDRPLIEAMTDGLAGGGHFGDLVVRIVTSEQFRSRRSQ